MADIYECDEFSGHEWEDAGGGLMICAVCLAEEWADEDPDAAIEALHPEWSGRFGGHLNGEEY